MLSCLLNGERINCYDKSYSREQLKKWASKKILLCPACDKPYEYCHGKVKSPYFRHIDKEQCKYKYSEPETEEHINGKRDLYEWIKVQAGVTDAVLEGWIPETKQRPDIMFKYYGKQCVIEYQCTPISSEYYERHELYEAAGIKDIWICGTQKYFQFYHKGYGIKQINILEEQCGIYYNSKNKCIYKIDKNLDDKNFDKIIQNKTYVHLMKNPYDYKISNENFYLVKDKIKSYTSYLYYPSPTGRPSNKYPYPVTAYAFNENLSLAKCMKLDYLKLKSID